jgi:hypothetical protein
MDDLELIDQAIDDLAAVHNSGMIEDPEDLRLLRETIGLLAEQDPRRDEIIGVE